MDQEKDFVFMGDTHQAVCAQARPVSRSGLHYKRQVSFRTTW
ncbi:hypothetical protein PCH70_28610 [Pseudomonas cichorii JBC1]|nr:hypothetical protein PCH70_28610 [Pseudomonas cichorii JBC1]